MPNIGDFFDHITGDLVTWKDGILADVRGNGPNGKDRYQRPKKAQQDPCEETSMQHFNRKSQASAEVQWED